MSLQASTLNLLLRALSPADFALLDPHLERVRLKSRTTIVEPNQAISHVFFPEGGVVSIVAEQDGGDQVEVGLFGREGMSGSAVVTGATQSPHRSMLQIDQAHYLTISSERLSEACERSRTLHDLMLKFTQALSVQTALTAASNASYALPERLARWLLMCHDRLDGDQIELTHEFMAMMLAVRRSGVTVTLHTLQDTGAISNTRGAVFVVDRDRLEEIAGGAYGGAESEYRRLIAPFGKGGHRVSSKN